MGIVSRRRLFLHIGHPKTGTTSIQTWFLANREALRSAGILYPTTGLNDSAHRLLSPAFYAQRHLPNEAPAVMHRLIREIESSSCSVVFISFEGFGLDHPRSLALLRELGEVTVIYYVRRQDHLAESMYAQHVRSFLRMEIRPPDLWLEQVFHCDYLAVAERFATFFGADRFRLRPFEPTALAGGDVVKDILNVMGVTPPSNLPPPTSRNETLRRSYLSFKRALNLLPLLEEEHRLLARQLTMLSQHDTSPSPRHLFSPDTRLALLERHASLNATLAREFLERPDGRLFQDTSLDPNAPWAPLTPLAPSDQWDIFERLSPEGQAILTTLYRPARLANRGEPLLPHLPDGNESALERLSNMRLRTQLQRRLARLECAARGTLTPPPQHL